MNLISDLRKVVSLLVSLAAFIVLVLGFSFVSYSTPAIAGTDPYIGEVAIIANTYCPEGHLEANGQILLIRENTALFSLLGTTYGGNGSTTFALPNLSSRFPIGVGGSNKIRLGEEAGSNFVTLTNSNLPSHSHNYATSTVTAASGTAQSGDATVVTSISTSAGTAATANTGGNLPVNIMPPYLGLKYCIATQGFYPSRP
jgi:microcystin-dependent protein